MIIVPDTKENRTVRNAVASMAIENMYYDEAFIRKLLLVANGKMTSEELRREVLNQYIKNSFRLKLDQS